MAESLTTEPGDFARVGVIGKESRLRVFFICQRVPYPPDRGDKIATFHLLRHFARRNEVHVFCLANDADLGNVRGLEGVAASVTAVRLGRWSSLWRALRALSEQEPLSIAMLAEPALQDALRSAACSLQPDLVFVYSATVAQFAEPIEGAERIMHFADLDSQKWRQMATRAGLPMRWVYALEARRVLDYERRIAAAFSHSMVCTEQEARDFRRLIPGRTVSVLRNGVDLDRFRPGGQARGAEVLVFTGVMNYAPNVDAMLWFCNAILPLIRRAVPGVTLVICGSAPTRAIRRLARRPGVQVTRRVPDVQPFLDNAAVFVAPMRLGRGIQNKLLEAMATGLPVVTTSSAWRATGIADGDGIVAADTEAAFADATVALLSDANHRAAMGRAARETMERGFGWDAVLADADAVLDGTLRRLAYSGATSSSLSACSRSRGRF